MCVAYMLVISNKMHKFGVSCIVCGIMCCEVNHIHVSHKQNAMCDTFHKMATHF